MNNLILVISDDRNPEDQFRLALTKTSSPCQVEFVGSREEIPATQDPSLILLDLKLSREPAFEVLRWLRTEPRYRQTPVFVVGSDASDGDVKKAYSLGANSCLLTKSVRASFDQIAQGIATYASLIQRPSAACQ